MRAQRDPPRWGGFQTSFNRALMDDPGFDRSAYEDRVDWELERIQKNPTAMDLEYRSCEADPVYFFSRYFKHEDIHQPGRVVRLLLNRIQVQVARFLASGQYDEYVALKARKAGMSTLFDAMIYWEARFKKNLRAAVIAHERDSTSQLFERLRFAHDSLPDFLRIQLIRSNVKEIRFLDRNSVIRALTAGNTNIGRGSDLDRIHFSEAAFYPNLRKMMAGVGEATRPGYQIYWESTPNGFEEFRTLYMESRDNQVRPGEPRRRAIFFRWYEDRKNRLALAPEDEAEIQKGLTPEEKTLVSVAGLDLNQIAWRRVKKETLGDDFDQEHPENDETCFLVSGSKKFNVRYWRDLQLVIQSRVRPLELQAATGKKPDLALLDDGNLTLWELPVRGHEYAIGADVAEGLPRGDWSTAGVLDITDLSKRLEVGEYRGKISPGDFGVYLARLGLFFNRARLGIERNNHGHATIRAARVECGYSPMYRHKEIDHRGKNVGRLGFPTTPGTRRELLDRFQRACLAGEHIVRSARLCGECMTFKAGQEDRKVDDGMEEADSPADTHDDLVFGWAIADWVALKGSFAVA